MPLFGQEPKYTKVPTGLYGYDIEAERAAEQIGQARARSEAAPVYGPGGLVGSALKRRSEMEGAFLNASVDAMARRRQQEAERLRREAEIRNQRRQQVMAQQIQNVANVTRGGVAMGQDIGSQAAYLSGREMSGGVVGDRLPELLKEGIVQETGDDTYMYTPRGVARGIFARPFWGMGSR